MEKFVVEKSKPLCGEIRVCGAKNAILPIIAATLLTKEKCTIKEAYPLSDVNNMLELVRSLGADTCQDEKKGQLEICAENIANTELCYEAVKKIRASFLLAGALLARFGRVRIQLPGGCPIGVRPIDLHLKGFNLLGAKVKQEHGIIDIKAKRLKGAEIYLDFPSVGATENIMLAAALAEGETTLVNCAVEPEVVDLGNFLNKMGAKISGCGTDKIRIKGVECLYGVRHKVIPDRIEAGTFMLASVITGGELALRNVNLFHLNPVISKLREMNVEIAEEDNCVRLSACNKLKNINIKTLPFPGFPTDMQAQFMSLMSVCQGTGIVNETVFENRFMHIGELNRMGADIRIESKSAIIKGVDRLTGAKVCASDLRAGAALIISALRAEGKTEIGEIHHIDRGYYNIDEKLRSLGANIIRIEND